MKRFICNCLGVFSLCWVTLIVSNPCLNGVDLPVEDYQISIYNNDNPAPTFIDAGTPVFIPNDHEQKETVLMEVEINYKGEVKASLAEAIRILRVLTGSEASEVSERED